MPLIEPPSHSTSPSRSLRKRKWTPPSSNDQDAGKPQWYISDFSGDEDIPAPKKKRNVAEVPIAFIRPPPLAFPKSLYDGYQAPMPAASEKNVLQDILVGAQEEQNETHDVDADEFIDAELEDFVIYREHRSIKTRRQKGLEEVARANELVSLHEINEWNVQRFFFDGVIWHNGKASYVQRVPFEILSIGGYGEIESPASEPDVWIQTPEGKTRDVWYRLRKPAVEYHRYHEPFLWMAQLAKQVVDFLSTHHEVTLDHFRKDFYQWLNDVYGSDPLITSWMGHYKGQDFRHVIASQANFLWCQATQIDEQLENQPLWSESHPRFLTAIPEEEEKRTKSEMFVDLKEGEKIITRRKTTVTPYVYECFKHLPWAKFLYCQFPSAAQEQSHIDEHTTRNPSQGFEVNKSGVQIMTDLGSDDTDIKTSINVGDVVALPLDEMTTWKSNDTDWLGYVQSITDTPRGRVLGLLWLYRPSDTQCLKASYPHSKELFLSDHCNCGDLPIYYEEVIRKVKVAFFGRPTTREVDHFVRQKYVEADGAWQTLSKPDFVCNCRKAENKLRYCNGDTLLVSINDVLEPAVLVEYEPDGCKGKIKIRRLLRRRRDYQDSNAEPNELILTDQYLILSNTAISRDCQIRIYTEAEREQRKIPAPYNRQGTGDFFFITSQDMHGLGLQPVAEQPAPLKEGWDPQKPSRPPMKGLDIFCGGGSFGRGLEECCAAQFVQAVDWYNQAIHTYKANLPPGSKTKLFRGSVNDYLTQAMRGTGAVSTMGNDLIEIIIAGSPCQGFSLANPNKGNDSSLLNVSMVTSVVAFIDFYRPKYAILENVKGMATMGPDTENMLALVMSALVGMGYQVRTFALDAWNFGCPQSRSRIFISVTAPGLTPLPEPPHTHSHPENVISASLGKLANGMRAGSRYVSQTPFKHVTSAEATRDLPLTDARVSCIPFPDHGMSKPLSVLHRVQIGSIPRFPRGNTFITAAKQGYMPQAQMDAFLWSNTIRSRHDAKGWRRVERGALMPTVMTSPRPEDGACGTCLHWDEERLLTVMEVRRGQGIPDDEVLVGLPREQWKIIGNGVARPVALALGVSLRKAWLARTECVKNDSITVSGPSTIETNGRPSIPIELKMVLVNGEAGDIGTQVRSSTTPSSTSPDDKHGLLQSPQNIVGNGYHSTTSSEPSVQCFEAHEKTNLDREESDVPMANGSAHPDELITDHTDAFSGAFSHLAHGVNLAADSAFPIAIDKIISNGPATCLVPQQTVISKVTVTATTAVLHERSEPSPEL